MVWILLPSICYQPLVRLLSLVSVLRILLKPWQLIIGVLLVLIGLIVVGVGTGAIPLTLGNTALSNIPTKSIEEYATLLRHELTMQYIGLFILIAGVALAAYGYAVHRARHAMTPHSYFQSSSVQPVI